MIETSSFWLVHTGAKKKQLHVDKADDDVAVGGAYEALDDYDFM